MQKPTLLVMAAGMGSRYGGLKQIDPVSDAGEIIMDFSLYDALMAGFERVVFVIKEENLDAFRELIDGRAGARMETTFVFQKLDDIPAGFEVPAERVKPWGTGHAILAARDVIDGPFAVINADDYYGPTAFQTMYEFLEEAASADPDKKPYDYCMVGFRLDKTLTENGTVARGICETDSGSLIRVVERTKIMRRENGPAFTEDGETWTDLPEDSVASMNFWGFTRPMMDETYARFPAFLTKALAENPLKGEYFLPSIVQEQIDEGLARVKVLSSQDQWYGVTYKEDKENVVDALRRMKDHGLYPDILWRKR